MVNETGWVHCRLLLGKSRVVAKRFISIPRLELNAAVLSVKMECLLKKGLRLWEITKCFPTDSKVFIGYIKNDPRKLKTFVAFWCTIGLRRNKNGREEDNQLSFFWEKLICLKSCSSILKLHPFIDDEGILAVRESIQSTALENQMQQPVLLSKSCRTAEFVARWCHEQAAHAGRGMAMTQIGFSAFGWQDVTLWSDVSSWSVSGASSWEEGCSNRKMVHFLKERMNEEPTFTCYGVDLFRSFLVEGLSEGSQTIWSSVYLSFEQRHTHWGCILSEHWFIHHELKKIWRTQR